MQMNQHKEYDVFISHSSKDSQYVEKLYSYLMRNGVRPWLDTHDIQPGLPYARAIIQGLSNSSIVIVVISAASNVSEDVVNEIDNAHREKKIVIPVFIEDVVLSEELSYYLARKQWVIAYPIPEKQFETILNIVHLYINTDENQPALETRSKSTPESKKKGRNIKANFLSLPINLSKGFAVSVFALVSLIVIAFIFFNRSNDYSISKPSDNEIITVSKDSNEAASMIEAIDLGLTSQTLWANMNIGADSAEDFGYLFAWGEAKTKKTYGLAQYKSLVKSNIAGSPNDAAYANWGKEWCIPTEVQFQELINECQWKWTTKGKNKGFVITGKNGKEIFLPAAGWICSATTEYRNQYGYYWTANKVDDQFAKGLLFSQHEYKVGNGYQYYGRSIRPVLAKQNDLQ